MRLPTRLAPGSIWATLAIVATRDARMMCDDTESAMKRAMDSASADVKATSENAAAAFDALEARAAARLKALGADDAPAPKPEVTRSEFSISRGSAAKRAEAEEAMRLMRRKDTGELEIEHADAIRMAVSMAGQWLDAGLEKRAEEELLRVGKYCSYKTDVGAKFHLELAAILVKQGRDSEAKRLRTRVMQDAASSSLRWQAEQLLEAGSGTFQQSDRGPANKELNKLFQMPEW